MEKINTMTNGEKLVAGAGILMLIASFLPWYRIGILDFVTVSRNGWESPGALWSILAVLIGVIMAAAVLAPKFGNVRLPDLGGTVTWGQAFLGLGVAALVFVIIKFVSESSFLSYGFFLGLIAAVGLAAGGYLLYTEEKGTTTSTG